jgi:hypothetical protein
MPQLERSCTVQMPVDKAETCWNDFVAQQQQAGGQPDAAPAGNGSSQQQNPGTVYFNEAGSGQTEVTMQLNSDGIAQDDDSTLNQRVDGYLQRFKEFAEAH